MVSLFQKTVYKALKQIPPGKVTTYGVLARHIGCRSAQAIGQALKHNPFSPKVPCPRVIRQDRSLGGFKGSWETTKCAEKRNLLKSEGVPFDAAGKVQMSAILLSLQVSHDTQGEH